MSSSLGKWLLVVALIGVGVIGAYTWYKLRPTGIPAGFVFSNGRIEATEIDIATKYAGRIEQVRVREGNVVNPGQVVARMDTTELLAQLNESEAKERQADESRTSDEKIAELTETEFGFAVRDYKRYSERSPRTPNGRQTCRRESPPNDTNIRTAEDSS